MQQKSTCVQGLGVSDWDRLMMEQLEQGAKMIRPRPLFDLYLRGVVLKVLLLLKNCEEISVACQGYLLF